MKVPIKYLEVTYRGVVDKTVNPNGVTEERTFITERTKLKRNKLRSEVLKYVPFNDVVLVACVRHDEKVEVPVQVLLEYGKVE